MRLHGADDVRAGAWATRGHARQARVDPRLPHGPDARSYRALATCGCALIGQTRRSPGRQRTLRPARDGDRGEHSADHGVDPEQEDRGRDRRPGARRQGGGGAFMKTAGGGAAAGRVAGPDGNGRSRESAPGAVTAMEAPLGREVGNANEVVESPRDAQGARSAGPRGASPAAGCPDARARLVSSRIATPRIVPCGRHSHGEGSESFRRIIERQGGDPRVVDDYSRLPTAPDQHRVVASDSGTKYCEMHAVRGPRRRRARRRPGDTRGRCRPRRRDHGAAAAWRNGGARRGVIFLGMTPRRTGPRDAVALLDESVTIGSGPCGEEPLVPDEVRLRRIDD